MMPNLTNPSDNGIVSIVFQKFQNISVVLCVVLFTVKAAPHECVIRTDLP